VEDRLMNADPVVRSARAGAVAGLAFLLAVTAAWWALALWPVSGEVPAWLERTRWVCFNAAPNGLPDASGWLLLVGQPIGLLAVLMVGWGESLRAGLAALAAATSGRVLLVGSAGLLLLGLAAAGVRVANATGETPFERAAPLLPDSYPRLDRQAPTLGLVDQHGRVLEVADLAGRPTLVTFAFGQCTSVCPLIVREVLRVQEQAALAPRVVVVTLDPWRDTPSRLTHMAQHWELGPDAHVLSGNVEGVQQVLDAWGVARERNPDTGDVVHPPLVYILDDRGRIAFAATGGVATLLELLSRS
jgi:cytochrome oxidase Cu insertion factor (SCO1/SenC/PrrC family)